MDSQERSLWDAYASSGKTVETRNALVVRYLKHARYLAFKVSERVTDAVTLEELVSPAVEGLIQAVERFDPSRGLSFMTYSTLRIKGCINDWLRDQDRCKRQLRRKLNAIASKREELVHTLGRQATDDEVAESLGMSTSEWGRLLVWQRDFRLNQSFDWHDNTDAKADSLGETIEDETEAPSDRLQRMDWLRDILRSLSRSERIVMIQYYYNDETMKQIAGSLGLSESRVSQMHSQIIARMKTRFRSKPVETVY
jgi:RNA polymerase sigma factor FliA